MLSACDTPSLHPLASDANAIAEPAVLGRWKTVEGEDSEVWTVTAMREAVYSVVVEGGKPDERLVALLPRIGPVLFADFESAEQDGVSWHIPSHLFARVRVDGSTLRLAFVNFKWLARQIRRPSFPTHVLLGDTSDLVLTARTAQLRTYLEKVSERPEAFEKDLIFQRADHP